MVMFGGGYLNASTFVYGNELQGKGYSSREDIIIGSLIFLLAFAAVLLGFINLYFIKKLDIFHNAFGWFWASRTVGEVMVNILHAGYNAPVTFLQPQNIPVFFGILPYILAYIFATGSCLMHSVVSLNRCIAVYSPIKYKEIFTTRNCVMVIVLTWVGTVISAAFLVVFPCNSIGYSPQHYEYIFVKCSPDLWRDYSIVGTVINCSCLLLCFVTVLTDLSTLARIIYIRKVLLVDHKDKNFRRDIQFFAQTSVQNVTMIIATTMIVLANNRNHEGNKILQVLGFNTLLLTHINNALSLIFFNPEMNNSTFEYGSELQGRGEPTKEDLFIGGSIFTMAILTIFLSFVNLYFIKKVEIFHNAFGWLWASRTIAEMLVEMNHAVYNAPMTLFQPVDIPPIVGIIPYFIMYVGAVCSCLVHEIISVNRFVAVYSTVQYKIIFSKRNCLTLIALCWIYCIVSAPIYAVFPCNLIGYSPTLYEYVFVQCTPDLDRHISIVGTTMNIFCMVLCSFTLVTDFFTLLKIIKIRKALSLLNNEKHFRRDVRFFIQEHSGKQSRKHPRLFHYVPLARGQRAVVNCVQSGNTRTTIRKGTGHVRKSVYPPSHSRV
ncbi:hypothetical protein QR680_015983 [Steinernema hermaphroditum]|uniref:G-protein coupled receptors family 1 profile domain-containing protein n=1 Tax=Steinernema hermaphroditum TaxID=289476 RepID=A0AA39LLJ2_9BILA|nr:hypothetical protein QR680_015983 [Steinernema hermaphroditum]